MQITITQERLGELLRAAYEDGWDDAGTVIVEEKKPREPNEQDWIESVTADQFDLLKLRIRNGGQA